MADEVIISEYGPQTYETNGVVAPIYGMPVTSQVLDIGVASAAMDGKTAMVNISSNGTAFWYKIGSTAALAACTANTDGNYLLKADQDIDIAVPAGYFIDTAADA